MSDRVASLADVRTLLMDMDGVVYFEDAILPHVREFLAFLRREGIKFAFVTNGTGRWPEEHRADLAARGIDVGDAPIYTAGLAAADYLTRFPGARVYVIGEEGLRRQLVEVGGCVLEDQRPDFVVIGWTDDFDYRQLLTACRAIYRGAKLIVADPDVNDPSPDGPTPGSGAFAAAIQAATGASALAIGKPNRILFDMALRDMGAAVESSAILGDRLDSDIRGGLEVGMGTILVLTGIASLEMVEKSPFKPDWVVRDLEELHARWLEAIAQSAATTC